MTSVSPSDTPSPKPVSVADRERIVQAIGMTLNRKSYHFKLTTTGDIITLEGDYIAPDQTYVKGTIGEDPIEELWVEQTFYTRDLVGHWEQGPSGKWSVPPGIILSLRRYLFTALGSARDQHTNYSLIGEEIILDGIRTKRFLATPDAAWLQTSLGQPSEPVPPLLNRISLWIDLQTPHLYKFTVYSNLSMSGGYIRTGVSRLKNSPAFHPLTGSFPNMSFAEATVIISRPDDSSIALPAP